MFRCLQWYEERMIQSTSLSLPQCMWGYHMNIYIATEANFYSSSRKRGYIKGCLRLMDPLSGRRNLVLSWGNKMTTRTSCCPDLCQILHRITCRPTIHESYLRAAWLHFYLLPFHLAIPAMCASRNAVLEGEPRAGTRTTPFPKLRTPANRCSVFTKTLVPTDVPIICPI
jgi:hypothetical protein